MPAVESAGFVGRVTPEDIMVLYEDRKRDAGFGLARMREIQEMYNGDIAVPLPELNANERAMVPNRVRQGLQQIGNRVASALPNIFCPTLRPGIKSSDDRARDRRRALFGWWEHSKMGLVLRQRSRYFLGYSSAPVEVGWDQKLGVPCWKVLNPLTTFPAPLLHVNEMSPTDSIQESTRSLGWLQRHYPFEASILNKGGKKLQRDLLFTLLKYVDDYECVLVVCGQKNDPYTPSTAQGAMVVELERYPNRAEVCSVVVPRLVSLDREHGQFDGLAGMFHAESMLMALAVIATKKGVFADDWLVARPNEEPIIEQVPDSANGLPGIVRGADIQQRGVDPQFQTNVTMDRLAESQRMTAGLAPELQGVAGSNIRTARRGAQVLSAVVDFTVQEAQEAFEHSLTEENNIAIAFCRGYDDGASKTFHVTWPGAKGEVTYKPAETFDTDLNIVRYPLTGADAEGLVIGAGQRIGMGTMSKRSFMEIDPMIDEPEVEMDRVRMEAVELAFWSSVQTLAANPQGPYQPIDFALLYKLIVSDKMEPYDAVAEVQSRAQERQAAEAPPDSPAAQPGLSLPGQGAESPPAISGPQPSVENLAQLLGALRRPAMRISQETS